MLLLAFSTPIFAEGHGSATYGDIDEMMLFSLDTLALFDGQHGQAAYVAFQGRVYDVSETWPTGSHRGYTAGTDITDAVGESAHGDNVFAKLPQVGFLALNLWTTEELAKYNAKDENPPYIAVSGIVYDVSETWPTGSHRGYSAGTDITEPIGDASHGEAVLDKLPVVGAIVSVVLSAQELEHYDGQDGRSAFIAVNGMIYDVSETWPTGSHRGFAAGQDITDAIADSAHGMSVLGKLPLVGRLDN